MENLDSDTGAILGKVNGLRFLVFDYLANAVVSTTDQYCIDDFFFPLVPARLSWSTVLSSGQTITLGDKRTPDPWNELCWVLEVEKFLLVFVVVEQTLPAHRP